jgi:putative MATE family efflux protein
MKTQRDLTQGPIGRTLLLFALPTLGSNILQSLNASINMVWIGHFLGENALAATANAGLIIFLSLSSVFGFGMAASILIGQNFGRRDIDGARRAMGAASGIFLALCLVSAAAGYYFSDPLLHLMGTPAAALPLAGAYLRIVFLALPGVFFMTLLMMGLRGAGDSMTPLWFMILSALLDAVLNPLLIAGVGPFPTMGIEGSAIAMLIANYSAAAGLLAFIYWRDLPIRLRGAEWRYLLPDLLLLKTILGKGIMMGLQMLVMGISGLVMIGLVNREGVDSVAAYGVMSQVWQYVQMPSVAVSAAVSAMAAQNIGANKWDRVGAITRQGVIANVLMSIAAVLLITLFERPVLGLFLDTSGPAYPIASHIHLVAGWGYALVGVMMTLFGVVRANGAVLGPLLAMIVGLIPIRLGFAYLAHDWLGSDALWLSFPISIAITTLIAMLYYRFADWRGKHMVDPAEVEESIEHELLV